DEFFLVFHVLDAYGERLRTLVDQSGLLSSRSLALDVDELLDKSRLVQRERECVAREMERLARRIDESRRSGQLARALFAQAQPLGAVIATVQREFPYELSSQKPLGELLEGLPAPWRRIELEDAAEKRALGLWQPTRELLCAYDRI